MPAPYHDWRKSQRRFAVLYLLAILLPPVAVLLCGKPIQAILNVLMTLFLWFPGAVHAILVVNSHLADKRNKQLIQAIQNR